MTNLQHKILRRARIREAGFTLIEILVVLVILGILAGVVVPNIIGRAEGAKSKAAKAQVQTLVNAVDSYYLDVGTPPQSLDALVSDSGNSNWNGPYVKTSALKDPWQQPYEYRYPGQHGEFDIISLGADRSPGGEGKNADLNSWE